MPRLNGRLSTCAPRAAATSAVRSVDPSETTTRSSPGSSARSSSRTRPTFASSLKAGTIATRRSAASGGAAAAGEPATSVDTRPHPQADQLEQTAGAVSVGVLVQHPLARAAAERLRLRRVGEQLAVGGGRLRGVAHDDELLARLEPALDPRGRVGDDRGAAGGELERPRRGGRVDGRVRAPGDAEVDPGRRDRPREAVERDDAEQPRPPGVAEEVLAAEREVDVGQPAGGLADERADPLAAELVAVAVEEDVDCLLHRLRGEELGIRPPEHRLRPAGAELAQPVETALGIGDDEVVLARIGAVVVVEARVHPAELRQAHRHVAVVEDDRVGTLPLDELLQVPAPTRGHPPPDHLPREAVERRVLRARLGAAQVAVAAQAGERVADAGVGLALAVGRVRRRPPPGGLDRPAPVRRDDEVDALAVQALPELPPRGGAAVAEVEVDGGGDAEQAGRAHPSSLAAACYGVVRTRRSRRRRARRPPAPGPGRPLARRRLRPDLLLGRPESPQAATTANLVLLTKFPFGLVTVIALVFAWAGTVRTISLPETTLNGAATPPRVTEVTSPRFEPIRVTFVPGLPFAGRMRACRSSRSRTTRTILASGRRPDRSHAPGRPSLPGIGRGGGGGRPRGGGARALGEPAGELGRRHRGREEVPLGLVAAELGEPVPHGDRLDALGDDAEPEVAAELDRRADDHRVVVVALHV